MTRWQSVVVPAEHGGWGLTLEPVLLGLVIAPSWAGLCIGLAALLTFLLRTPLKLALVDVRRDRWLARSALALRVAVGEALAVLALTVTALMLAGWSWLVPVAVAMPLVAVESWYDVRSRGRRLVPELCGAVGMASVVAAVVLAGGESGRLAVGAWLVLAGRSVGAVPFVRVQITRLRRGTAVRWHSHVAQVAALALGAVAVVSDHRFVAGLAGLAVLAALQTAWVHRPPTAAKVLGLRQMALGFGLVAVTAAGVLAG
ncbi:MAG: YwiC-like family protein [Actinobacteria bacterium]|nr:YwiC-like family protein [Actinomycetota bacterium]